MGMDREKDVDDPDKTDLSAEDEPPADGEDDRNDKTADAQILGREDDQHAGNIGYKSEREGVHQEGERARRNALAAAELPPERKIVADRAAKACVQDACHAVELPGDQHGDEAFEEIADQNGDTWLKAEGSHNIGHAGISGVANFRGAAAGVLVGDDLAGQYTTETIADQETDQPDCDISIHFVDPDYFGTSEQDTDAAP